MTRSRDLANLADGVEFLAADHTKLDGIEASATADQTNAEIRAAVEAATDSNVFTDADHSKLNAVEASADVTDATNVAAAGALMDSELTNLAAVKAINQSLVTTATPTFAGLATTANVTFGDNDKAIFGAELEIYSDATHARIREYGGGQLKIQGDNMQLLTSDGASTYLEGVASTGAVTLYHASNAPRLATTASGVSVTGNLSAANATFSSASPLITGVDTDVDTRIFTIGGNNGNCIIDVDPNGTAGGSLFQVDVDNGEVLKLTSAGATVTGTNFSLDATSGGRYFDFIVDSQNSYLDVSHSLIFRTNGASSLGEKMRLSSDGDLMHGTTNASLFSATSGSGTLIEPTGVVTIARQTTASTQPLFILNTTGVDGTLAQFRKDGSVVGSIACRSSGGNLQIDTSQSGIDFGGDGYLPMRNGAITDNSLDIGSSSFRYQDIYLSGGVYLGGTGSANKLEDYEEGVYDATWQSSGNSSTVLMRAGYRNLSYVKIGSLVTVTGRWEVSGDSTLSGDLRFTLPFTIANGLTDQADTGVGTISLNRSGGNGGSIVSGHHLFQAVGFPGNDFFSPYYQPTTQTNEAVVQGSNLDANFEGYVHFQYRTN